MGKKLFIWSRSDYDQFCTTATVVTFTEESCIVRVDNTYGHQVKIEHHLTVDKALKALEHFEQGLNVNPEPPPTHPHKFKVLGVNNEAEIPAEFVGVSDAMQVSRGPCGAKLQVS